MTTNHAKLRLGISAALLLLPILGCVNPAEPARAFSDGARIMLALGGTISLSGDLEGAFTVADTDVASPAAQSATELVLVGAREGTTEVTFTSDSGVEVAAVDVQPVDRVSLEPMRPVLVGTSSSSTVRLHAADGTALDGGGLARIGAAPRGARVDALQSRDALVVTPAAPGMHRAEVQVLDMIAAIEFEAVSIHDAEVTISADELGMGERWLDYEVRYAGEVLRTPGVTPRWTVDGEANPDAFVPEDAFPAEICLTLLDRQVCDRVE